MLLRGDRLRDLPGHHATNPGGSAPADQETHRGVCDRIPDSAHKQDDGCIEGTQLEGEHVQGKSLTLPIKKQKRAAGVRVSTPERSLPEAVKALPQLICV